MIHVKSRLHGSCKKIAKRRPIDVDASRLAAPPRLCGSRLVLLWLSTILFGRRIRNAANGKNELYDLSADPGELANVIESHPDVAGRLEELLLKRQDEVEKLVASPCQDTQVPRKFR